ncbi:MAG: hypothetical protein ACERKO_01780 [Acetanaerobacterium sp.]
MNRNIKIYRLTAAALLCAVGIVIPMFSPVKVILEPASFTLASHVAIFLAMFISPPVAIAVSLGTTIGFFLGGFPIVIVFRALSHIVFATAGAFWLKYHPYTLMSPAKTFGFSCVIAVLHSVSELAVVIPFYFGNMLTAGSYDSGFVYSVILLVGIGTLVHSSVDFYISVMLWRALTKSKEIAGISTVSFKRD